jgi:hypothetical protein
VAFTQVTVTGTYRDAEGNDAQGAVVFTPTHAMRNGEIVVSAPRTAQIVAGAIDIDLAATDDAGTTPEGVVYEVSEHITGTRVRRTYYLAVPAAGGPVDLDTAPIVEDVPGAITFPVPGPQGEPGEPGPAGPAGRTILNGTTTPAAGLGANGDFYINTTADTIYGPKTSSGWGAPTPLVGPQGPPGADGTGAVDSVNTQTGTVVLDAADVGAATPGRVAALTLILGS